MQPFLLQLLLLDRGFPGGEFVRTVFLVHHVTCGGFVLHSKPVKLSSEHQSRGTRIHMMLVIRDVVANMKMRKKDSRYKLPGKDPKS